ncbi:MAG: GNAT family N-acetyltransferase [Flavobacteriales bacterium]|jgi:ribosomal protein S18 acetylase RimI-like enzyme
MLRPATPSDFQAIRDVVYEVWPIAYREMITQEQIAYMLTMMYSDESLLRQVTEEQCVFLVYEGPERIEGFASYSDLGNGIYKLHKLYVYTTMHGKGLGKVLLQEVKEAVVRAGGSSIELQVNKRNVAQHFYRKQGFEIERELVLDIGDGFVMDDFIMRWQAYR